MSIAPVVRSVVVKTPPAKTFDLFCSRIGDWWPAGKTVAKNPHVAIIIEPRPEGRWFERDAEGNEMHWGRVLAYDPPTRLLLGWQLNGRWTYDPDFLTEVEVTFQQTVDGGTKVTLEHRNLERFGADAETIAGQVGGGWPTFLGHFADYADAHA